MAGMIALSEVLDFLSMDAPCYRQCSDCKSVVRGFRKTCCGQLATGAIQTVGEVLALKRGDDHYADLVESIRLHGITAPILIYGQMVHNGHHRIAAAVDLGLEEIPWCNDSSIGWGSDWPDDSVLDCSA